MGLLFPWSVAAIANSLQMSLKHTTGQYANVVTLLQMLNVTYGIWWECSDLLVELSATEKEDDMTIASPTVSCVSYLDCS
jgi:hypothetical protein